VTSTVAGAAVAGGALRARTWRAEALLRALENVLDVAQRPDELVVYASFAKAARDHSSLAAIRRELLQLREGQTLVLQSGRPVGVLATGPNAPLVVSAVNNVVGQWQTPQRFWERAAADGTPVRAIVGDDPVEFAETFAQAYTGAHWIDKERARLTKAIEDVERAEEAR